MLDRGFRSFHGLNQAASTIKGHSDLFGLDSARSPELDDLLAQRKKLLTKAKLTASDRKKLDRLERKIGPLPGAETREDLETRELLRTALGVVSKGRRSGRR